VITRERGLLVADLDGTLQDPHGLLTAVQVATLCSLIAQDTFVAIVSGASVASIVRRVCPLLGPRELAAMLFYASNGGRCFRMSRSGPVFVYDHGPRFTRLGLAAAAAIAAHCEVSGFGAVATAAGHAARDGVVCMELTETQLTLTLAGLEHRRGELIGGLGPIIDAISGGLLDVRPAGARSADVCLAGVNKGGTVDHLIGHLPLLGWSGPWDVVIAGDSLWLGGADRDLMRPGLRGAAVFDAGRTADPLPDGFALHTPDLAGFDATYGFLRARVAMRGSHAGG
jgi:hypothetical protein